MFDTLPAQIGAAIAVAVCLFAFLKGDEPERIGAGTYMLLYFASLLVQSDTDLWGVQWGMFLIDLVMLGVFAGLAWRTHRAWPVWASALQLLVVMSHLVIVMDLRTPITSFYTVVNIAGLGIIVAIGVGTFWAWQERRAAGLE